MRKVFLFLSFISALIFRLAFGENLNQISVYPSTGTFSLEDEVSLKILLYPQQKIDTISGKLSLENLNCQGINLASNILALKSPNCSDLNFILGIPGGTQQNQELFLLRVKGKNPGEAKILLSISSVLSAGKEVPFTSQSGKFTFLEKCTCTPWSEWKIGECNQGGCVDKRVKVRNRKCVPPGCDIESEVECIEDPACKPKPKALTILPPRNLSGKFLRDKNSIFLSWESSQTKEISGYFILRKKSSEKYFKFLGSVSKNTLNFEDFEIEPNQTYSYVVLAFLGRSYQSSTKSGFSNKVEVKTFVEEIQPAQDLPKKENLFSIETDSEGKLKENLIFSFFDKKLEIEIPKEIRVFYQGKIAQSQSFSFAINFLEDIENLFEKNQVLKKLAIKGSFYSIEGPEIHFEPPIQIKIALPEEMKNEILLQGKVLKENFWQNLPTSLDFKNKIAILKSSHFSIFGLFLKLKPKTFSYSWDIENYSLFYLSNIFGGISIFGFIFYYLWKKNKKSAKIEKGKFPPKTIDLRKIKL